MPTVNVVCGCAELWWDRVLGPIGIIARAKLPFTL